jgi:hypothetical protein
LTNVVLRKALDRPRGQGLFICVAEGSDGMESIWERYRPLAATSLAMAQTTSSMKEIAALLAVTQFWVQLTERTIQDVSAEPQSA